LSDLKNILSTQIEKNLVQIQQFSSGFPVRSGKAGQALTSSKAPTTNMRHIPTRAVPSARRIAGQNFQPY
jgi:hypothetical protein